MRFYHIKLFLIIFPFIILPILLIFNGIVLNPIARTEAIWIPTSIEEMAYANVYYPKSPHASKPVVIIFHGLSLQNDIDYRMTLELTKRGFCVISVDQSGHGRTYGIQPGLQDDVFKPFFFRNVVDVVDYIYSRQDMFNTSAVGCMGFSLGGMTTLMATVIEPRINASVSWAGPTNLTALDVKASGLFDHIKVSPENNFFSEPELQRNHSVVEYWNGSYGEMDPKNLLLIHGTNDIGVNVSQAREAYQLVNDPSKCDLIEVEGAGHELLSHITVNETIVWFETKLLGGLQAPVNFAQFTYVQFYVLYFLILLEIYSSVFGIGFILYKAREKYWPSEKESQAVGSSMEENSYPRAFLNLLMYSLPVLGTWALLYFTQNLFFNHLITLLLGGVLLVLYEGIFYGVTSRESINKENIKALLKAHINPSHIIIAIGCAVYLLGFYYLVAYIFKFLMFGPRSILLYLISILAVFPFVLSYEIYQRKFIQEQFPQRSEIGKWFNRLILYGFAIISYIPLYMIIFGTMISVLVIVIILIAVTTINIYLYEKSQNVFATSLFSALVVGFFVAHCYYFFI